MHIMLFFKLLSILFASSVPYLFTLNGDFVFDDTEAIIKNKDVTTYNWRAAFVHDFWGSDIKSNLSHKSYRPLTILSFKLNYLLSGYELNATHFKITNLIIHMISCILVWSALEGVVRMTEKKCRHVRSIDIAYVAALLFCTHPIHVEAVSGIVGRADVLAATTFFTGFWMYNKAMSSKLHHYNYFVTSTMFAMTSMFFKESGVTLLGVCMMYEVIIKYRTKSINKRIGNQPKDKCKGKYLSALSYTRLLVLLGATLGLLQLRWTIMAASKPAFKPTDNPAYFSDTLFTRVASYNYIYFLNAVIHIWPQWLCYDWSLGCVPLIKDIYDPRILAIAVIYLYAYLVIGTLTCKKINGFTKRILMMGSIFVIVPFLPASNILYPVGFVIAERVLYIPSVGYCLLIGLGVNKIVEKGKGKLRKITIVLVFGLVVINGLRSWQRSRDWQTEYSLFVDGLSVCPLNAKVRYNVAKVADANKNTEWAIAEYKEAIRLYPEYYQALNNLGNLLKSQKKYDEAEYFLRNAVSHKRDFPVAWMNLGIVLSSTGRYEESQKAYKKALHYRKNYTDCFYNLGNLYLEMNRTDDAMAYWIKAINLRPTHVLAWTNLLALLDNTGNIDYATNLIPKALKALPNSPSICFAIANIFGKMEQYENAESYFKKALKLFGDNAQAIHYANLGVLYHRWKKYTLAEEMYTMALKIDPKFASAQKNLLNLKKSA